MNDPKIPTENVPILLITGGAIAANDEKYASPA